MHRERHPYLSSHFIILRFLCVAIGSHPQIIFLPTSKARLRRGTLLKRCDAIRARKREELRLLLFIKKRGRAVVQTIRIPNHRDVYKMKTTKSFLKIDRRRKRGLCGINPTSLETGTLHKCYYNVFQSSKYKRYQKTTNSRFCKGLNLLVIYVSNRTNRT